ncbi:MAG: hypothetical protein H6658_11510 [Ardenticatenaceae bacterium]|nr:hypothetical protein [Ardenticatenaceae bacterium]
MSPKKRFVQPKQWVIFVCLYGYLASLFIACTTPPSAASAVVGEATANPALIATAQADQYLRDAAATLDARNLTQQAVAFEIQLTAQANTATSQAQQTLNALNLALTADSATVQAQETFMAATQQVQATAVAATERANTTITAQVQQNAAATSTASALATVDSLQATRQAAELEQALAAARREQIVTLAVTIMLGLASLAAATLLILFFWKIIPILVNRLGLVRYGQHGNVLLLSAHNGQLIVTDPLRMHQASLIIDEQGQVTMPDLTAEEIQTLVTGGVLRTLMEQARHAPGHPPRLPDQINRERHLGPLSSSESIQYASPPPNTPLQEPTLPPESFLADREQLPLPISWPTLQAHTGNGLVLGMGLQGVIRLNLAYTPHILLSGSSGAGKTRRALRPMVAQALAQGAVVVLLNESAADFSPFYDHPNAFIMHGQAHTYMQLLQSALGEMARRENILRQARVSEWSRLPDHLRSGPPVLIVIDEVLSLAMLMSSREQRQFWGLLATYASRARKLSMGSIGALTDPTYRILGPGLNWREQCNARISFRVAKANISRAVLDTDGAESLGEGQFLAMLGSQLEQGTAANPSDHDLTAFLTQHPVPPVTCQDWLLVSQNLEPVEPLAPVQTSSVPLEPDFIPEPELVLNPQIPFSHDRPPTPAEQQYMQQLYNRGMSKNRICRQVYGFKNGKTYAWVTEAVAGME